MHKKDAMSKIATWWTKVDWYCGVENYPLSMYDDVFIAMDELWKIFNG